MVRNGNARSLSIKRKSLVLGALYDVYVTLSVHPRPNLIGRRDSVDDATNGLPSGEALRSLGSHHFD